MCPMHGASSEVRSVPKESGCLELQPKMGSNPPFQDDFGDTVSGEAGPTDYNSLVASTRVS